MARKPANLNWVSQPFAVGDRVFDAFLEERPLEGVVVEVHEEHRWIGQIVVRWSDVEGTCIESAERLFLVLPLRKRHL